MVLRYNESDWQSHYEKNEKIFLSIRGHDSETTPESCLDFPNRQPTIFVYIWLPLTALVWLRHLVFHWFYANMSILHNKTCHKLITPYSWSWHNISWCRKIRSQPLKIDFLTLRWSGASKADITNGGVFWFGLALRHRSDVILNSLYDWFSAPIRVVNPSGLWPHDPTLLLYYYYSWLIFLNKFDLNEAIV